MKNSADLGGCYRPSASVDNTLLDLQNSSYPTQPHSIIANYNVSLSTFATVDRPSSRSVNIFVKHKSNLCWVCFIFSEAIIGQIYQCLVRFSFENLWRLTVKVVFSLMEINNFSPQVPNLWLVRNEQSPILLFWARVVIGRKRFGGPGWVRYTVTLGGRDNCRSLPAHFF